MMRHEAMRPKLLLRVATLQPHAAPHAAELQRFLSAPPSARAWAASALVQKRLRPGAQRWRHCVCTGACWYAQSGCTPVCLCDRLVAQRM